MDFCPKCGTRYTEPAPAPLGKHAKAEQPIPEPAEPEPPRAEEPAPETEAEEPAFTLPEAEDFDLPGDEPAEPSDPLPEPAEPDLPSAEPTEPTLSMPSFTDFDESSLKSAVLSDEEDFDPTSGLSFDDLFGSEDPAENEEPSSFDKKSPADEDL